MHPLIESNPKIMLGKPVMAGMRITVEFTLEQLATGESMQDLLESHPRLSETAVRAALSYSAYARPEVLQLTRARLTGPSPIRLLIFYPSRLLVS